MSSQLQDTTGLLQRLARLYPQYGQAELLRMALLIALHPSHQGAGSELDDVDSSPGKAPPAEGAADSDECLRRHSQEISLQLSAASDQHAALAAELDGLAATSPCDFSPGHLFTLVRAIRVQSRVLDWYLGPQQFRC